MTTTTEIFDDQKTFADLGLPQPVLQGVEQSGFKYPTLIQAQLIPRVLAGKDVIGQAKTGTGKTAAFGLPILAQADTTTPMQALILTPTRELAAQVAGEMEQLGRFTNIHTSCIIGGESMREQSRSLQKGGHIIVGTPGRVMDMHGRGQIHFDNIRYVVLDEVDRMLDIGFREDIRKILKSIRHEHQTVFVSATISDEIERLARSYMKPDVEKIMTTSGSLTVSLVEQRYLPVEPWDKPQLLLHLLTHTEPDLTVVFCRTKATVHRVSKYLRDKKINCREIHGDLSQKRRNSVMNTLRTGALDVLVASDLAARGLDIDDISHVINYDLPDDPEVYIHRIGRTARAGRRGIAWSFVTSDQGQLLTEIEKIAGTIIEKLEYPDFTPGPVPADVRVERERAQMRRADPMKTLASRSAPLVPPAAAAANAPEPSGAASSPSDLGYSPEELARMFPDGNIPKSLPRRTLGSRFRTRRSR